MVPLLLVAAVFGCGLLQAQTPSLTADDIMQRVGANQDRAEELRRQFVYKQHVRVVSRKTNGKVMQEEASDYVVVPGPQGSDKKLTQVAGKYWQNREYVNYSGELADRDTLDSDLVSDLRDNLVNENRAKDGIAPELFPLTSKEQQKYVFRLLGDDVVNGRKAYRVGFRPKKNEDTVWKGEALIDAEEFQPVTVFTRPARHVPLWIRTALGTDLPGIGFSVTYKRQGDGLWFPVTFGTEFRLRAIFFINRQITMTLQNNDFERTHVDSVVHYDESSLHR
ncbi:MAG: hypothetical protein ACJ71Q_08620 [Terriglobales bacterium]